MLSIHNLLVKKKNVNQLQFLRNYQTLNVPKLKLI